MTPIHRKLRNLKLKLIWEWNKPKAKNAKPGQKVRDYSKIKNLHQEINDTRDDFKN